MDNAGQGAAEPGMNDPYRPVAPAPNNEKAITSLVLALIGLIVTPLSLFLGPLAWYYGSIARREIAQSGQGGGELALIGLIIGAVLSILWIVAIVALIVVLIVAAVLAS